MNAPEGEWLDHTWNVATTKAIRAPSLMPVRLIRVKITRMQAAPTKTGNGSDTSPERYEAAVAAEITEVDAKSNIRRAAPIKASDLVDIFSL